MSTEKNESLSLLEAQKPTLQALVSLNYPTGVDSASLITQEVEYLRQRAISLPAIFECVPTSVVMAVKSVLKNNLTLDPQAGLVYIKTRNVKVGTPQGDKWVKVLEITESCNGLLSIAYQCGKILDHKNPIVKKDDNGKVIGVEFEYQVSTGRWEKREFDESDIERWKIKSHEENGRKKDDANKSTLNYANALYSSWKGGVDPEFARAKAIRHGLKKLGTNANEKFAVKIQVPKIKQVVIDEEIEKSAISDEAQYTEVEELESTEDLNKSLSNVNL